MRERRLRRWVLLFDRDVQWVHGVRGVAHGRGERNLQQRAGRERSAQHVREHDDVQRRGHLRSEDRADRDIAKSVRDSGSCERGLLHYRLRKELPGLQHRGWLDG